MAAYRVVVKPSVEKDLRSVPPLVAGRAIGVIAGLREEPFSRNCVKLAGTEGLYRIRVGQYRVIYAVDRAARSNRPGHLLSMPQSPGSVSSISGSSSSSPAESSSPGAVRHVSASNTATNSLQRSLPRQTT